ncbi:dihydrolipoyllysine-residue succinyltransferase [Candidatus Marinamargulisbacteria bacterium SCGC AG-410-N11]|nr:dihydrolipoyllysine-residue succinyltransferase [Candidatus Marinamargulisbacteria bacterium SCGC AG-410-N11]
MKKEIVVPSAGESVTEADIVSWYKSNGDFVEMDDPLLELETDKASMDLCAETSGILNIKVSDGTVGVGDVIGHIEESAKPAEQASVERVEKNEVQTESNSQTQIPTPTKSADSVAAGHPAPSAAKLMSQHSISKSDVVATGRDGRILKQDVKNAIDDQLSNPSNSTSEDVVVESVPSQSREPRREKLSRMRKTIMKRLVETQQTSALLTTFNEVDMSAVMDIRKKYKDMFKEKHNVGLGFMSFFTKSVCRALQEHPVLNASVEGENIVYHDYYDIGVAVATPKGLVVPVVRDADKMSFFEVEKSILDLALKGRDGKLTIQEMEGGTFTITNGGVFGSMLSTPILNYPQSAILGMHNIVQRPTVVNGEVVVRPIMYLAVTYDHRIIDGADAVRFLVKIKEQIEDPTRLLVGV